MSQQVSAKKQQELQAQYSNYKETLQAIAQKIGDVETEAEEHKLVLETLEPLPGDRKCFRMINGVLVERTVQDVLPQLKTNADGLKKVLEDLLKQYTTKQEELEKWKRQNKIQVVTHSALILTRTVKCLVGKNIQVDSSMAVSGMRRYSLSQALSGRLAGEDRGAKTNRLDVLAWNCQTEVSLSENRCCFWFSKALWTSILFNTSSPNVYELDEISHRPKHQ
ncbi:hypothetical protein KCU62_g2182, partial [Aureobasidium sp. EXF-3399]